MTTKGQVIKMICYLEFIREFAVLLTPLSSSCFSRKLHLPLRVPSRVSIEAKFIGVAGSFWQTVAKQGLAFQTNKQPAGLNSITQLSSQFSSVQFSLVVLCCVLFCFAKFCSVFYTMTLLYHLLTYIAWVWLCIHLVFVSLSVHWGCFFGGWVWYAGWMDGWMPPHKSYTPNIRATTATEVALRPFLVCKW